MVSVFSEQNRRFLFLTLFFVFCGAFIPAYAENAAAEPVPVTAAVPALEQLLTGYLQNDLELKQLSLTAQQTALTAKSTAIDNGIAVTLSTGSIVIKNISGTTRVTVSPEATLSIPQANGLEVTAGGSLILSDGTAAGKDASVSLSMDILSGDVLTRKITLLKAERTVLEAKRAVQDRAVTAEKEFYTALNTLYGYANDMYDKDSDLYDDEVALKKLDASGYSKTSSTYRKSALTVQTDRREIEEYKRLLTHETQVFARKCGYECTVDALAFLPSVIPAVEMLDVTSFPADAYTATETALWSQYIGRLTRQADKVLTLKGALGYTISNSSTSTSTTTSTNTTATYSDTVDQSLTLSYRGVTAKAGVSLPTGSTVLGAVSNSSTTNPVYTMSLGFDPATMAKRSITDQQNMITAQLEDVAVASAKTDYDDSVADKKTSLGDIQWSLSSNAEEYAMYRLLASDMESGYKQGIKTESEYLDAVNNRENSRLNCLVSAVDALIYNDEVRLLFHTDKEGSK